MTEKCKTCGGSGYCEPVPGTDERSFINNRPWRWACPTCHGTGKQPKEAEDD